MDTHQIIINTESFLDYLDNDKDIRYALSAVKEMGYEAVELWHVKSPENGASWKLFLDESGLSCVAIHELYEEVIENVEGTIKKAVENGAEYVAIGRSKDTEWEDEVSVKKFAVGMNALAQKLAKAGLKTLYHNHNTEFCRLNGKASLEVFFDNTDPALVGSELDVYWVQLSGANPVTWCKKMGERLKIVHLKDIDIVKKPEGGFIKNHICTAIGSGNMEIPEIIKAAQSVGCRIFAIETCTDWKDNDSLRCAKESFDYLKAL